MEYPFPRCSIRGEACGEGSMMPHRLQWVTSRVLGLLLLVAAGLKAYGVAVEPVGSAGLFSAPGFQIAVVQFEIVLGVWLLWGIKPVGAWAAAVATFACFAGVSFYLGWEGQTSCG